MSTKAPTHTPSSRRRRPRLLLCAVVAVAAVTALVGATGSGPGSGGRSASGVRTGIPDSVLLTTGQLPVSAGTDWVQLADRRPVPRALADPDHCDPAPEFSSGGSPYPADLHPVAALTRRWAGPSGALAGETVISYPSPAAAAADFARHRSWLPQCADHFSWTDLPHAQTVTALPMPGSGQAYAIRVAMYPPDRSAADAGSQGRVYFTALQVGNAVAFLTVSSGSAAPGGAPHDPGPSWTATAFDTLRNLLTVAFPAAPSRTP
ncbi:hypothetical protein GCM10009760_56460 [Kitasatospora kazusensis]|uniref:PknH-like protein n=1 Tax=Kitasatospora kazusensis TaxID=407974 RepID=A0ABN3A865_9ACTN